MKPLVRSIVFDFGGVLSEPIGPGDFAALGRVLGADPSALPAAYFGERREYDRGVIDAREYWRRVSDRLGLKGEMAAAGRDELVRLDVGGWGRCRAEMIRLAGSLRAQGFKTAILSNMPRDKLDLLRRGAAWLASFPVQVFSCEERLCKPEEAIYRILLDRLAETPARVLFIDDALPNVEASRALAMQAIQYRDHADLLRKFKEDFSITV